MLYKQTAAVAKALLPVKDNCNLNVVWKAPEKVKELAPQFASILAHEIRNPLTNINLSVDILEALITDDSQKIYLDIIKRSYTGINDLISILMKKEADDTTGTRKQSLQQLLDDVLVIAGDRITLKNIEVQKNYAPVDFKMIMDEPKMKIAVTNMIVNAVDAMASEGGMLALVTGYKDGKFVVRIEDNGCGIKKENLKNIFQPYFTTKANGLGVGLALSYTILKANGADITIESTEGRGTTFMLSFNND
jgi:signal transduction histidine kinase